MKKFVAALTILVVLISGMMSVSAVPPYQSYNFEYGNFGWNLTPEPYLPSDRILDTVYMGLDFTFKNPEDFCFDNNGNVYIMGYRESADKKTNTSIILILDPNFKFKKTIESFDNNGKKDTFNGALGLIVGLDGFLYVADTGNARIVKMDTDGKFISIIGPPDSEVVQLAYQPKKIAVDAVGVIFVLSDQDNNGILRFEPDGVFSGYMGSNRVMPNALELLWRKISTQAQKDRMMKFVPIEYNNIKMDSSGFIYTTCGVSDKITPIRKLNSQGKDLLVKKSYTAIDGDTTASMKRTMTMFVDIAIEPSGIYNAIDAKSGKIFTYGNYGHLLYEFGRNGSQVGTFALPAAIETRNDYIYVLDRTLSRITEFEMTDYARLIKESESAYVQGEYEKSLQILDPLIKMNANYNYAYVLAGNALLAMKDYEKAMEYFMLGHYPGDQTSGYSRAMKEYRRIFMRENFGKILTGLVVLIVLAVVYKQVKKRKNKKDDTDWEGDSA